MTPLAMKFKTMKILVGRSGPESPKNTKINIASDVALRSIDFRIS